MRGPHAPLRPLRSVFGRPPGTNSRHRRSRGPEARGRGHCRAQTRPESAGPTSRVQRDRTQRAKRHVHHLVSPAALRASAGGRGSCWTRGVWSARPGAMAFGGEGGQRSASGSRAVAGPAAAGQGLRSRSDASVNVPSSPAGGGAAGSQRPEVGLNGSGPLSHAGRCRVNVAASRVSAAALESLDKRSRGALTRTLGPVPVSLPEPRGRRGRRVRHLGLSDLSACLEGGRPLAWSLALGFPAGWTLTPQPQQCGGHRTAGWSEVGPSPLLQVPGALAPAIGVWQQLPQPWPGPAAGQGLDPSGDPACVPCTLHAWAGPCGWQGRRPAGNNGAETAPK